jgi:hypothetical protein
MANEGTLYLQPSRRWAVCRPGRYPVEIASGEPFRVEVPGKDGLQLTRMEYRQKETFGGVVQLAGHYSVDDFELRNGLRAAIGSGERPRP